MGGGRPNVFWLTGLFNPQGFLTANRQEVCRKHSKEGWALDDVVNLTKVINMERDEVRKGPDEGCYIYGLFLDGCRWDKPGNKLADSVPKVLFAPLPVLHVTGVLASERKLDAYSYSAPCYKNKTRRGLNFVFPVDLRARSRRTSGSCAASAYSAVKTSVGWRLEGVECVVSKRRDTHGKRNDAARPGRIHIEESC